MLRQKYLVVGKCEKLIINVTNTSAFAFLTEMINSPSKLFANILTMIFII